MIRRQIKHRRNRRQDDPSQVAAPPGLTFEFPTPDIGQAAIVLVFNQPYLNAVPFADGGFSAWANNQGSDLIRVDLVDAVRIRLTFSVALDADVELTIPANDPTLRTAQAGYVVPGVYGGT